MNDPNECPSSPEVQEMSVCERCGHMVPTMNLALHEARGCPNREPPARRRASEPRHASLASPSSSITPLDDVMIVTSPVAATASAPLEIYDTDQEASESPIACHSPPTATHAVAQANLLAQPTFSSPILISSPPIVDGFEVIEHPTSTVHQRPSEAPAGSEPNSPWHRITSGISNVFCPSGSPFTGNMNSSGRAASSPAVSHYPAERRPRRNSETVRSPAIDLTKDDHEGHGSQDRSNAVAEATEWTCPRCTLLNPIHSPTCDACQFRKDCRSNTSSRALRANGLTTQQYSISNQARSTHNVAVGGALLGGVLGAASALARGRPVAGAALDGALNGAVGSVVLNEIVQQVERGTDRHVMENPYRRRQVMERRSMQDLLARQLMEDELNRALRSSGRRRGYARIDPTTEYLITFGGMQPAGNHIDVSRMSYEELLARFGDGSENRGATDAQLNQLPVQRIDDASKLGEEGKQCSICLEEFKVGDKRKTLPCLHGFHERCANTWLRTNASCPICKHRIGA